jgi:FkbM family methyltransferase
MELKTTFHSQYVRLIATLLWLNESLFFYPALRRFYRNRAKANKALLIVDVGANRGQSIRFFKSCFPEALIHAFEPNPKLYKYLLKKIRDKDIHIYAVGISNQKGRIPFYEHILDETSSFEMPASGSTYAATKNKVLLVKEQNAIKRTYEVEVNTLDEMAQQYFGSRIDILKIDVEGHEAAVLEGASGILAKQAATFIQLEQHYDDQYEHSDEAIHQLLANYGYRECYRKKHGFGNFYEVIFEVAKT